VQLVMQEMAESYVTDDASGSIQYSRCLFVLDVDFIWLTSSPCFLNGGCTMAFLNSDEQQPEAKG